MTSFPWEIDLAELAISVNLAASLKLDGDAPRAADAQIGFPLLLMVNARKSPPFEDLVGGERPEGLVRGSGYFGKAEDHARDTVGDCLRRLFSIRWLT